MVGPMKRPPRPRGHPTGAREPRPPPCVRTRRTSCGLELGRFLQPGSIVEREVEQISALRNRVTA
jgi:hypothetical protein